MPRARRQNPLNFGFRSQRKSWWLSLILLAVVGISYVAKQQGWIKGDKTSPSQSSQSSRESQTPSRETRSSSGEASNESSPQTSLSRAIRAQQSGAIVEAAGVVSKILPDDNDGARHQRFVVRVGSDTVLIAHNLDLADRAPVKEGDLVRFKGEYEWNDRGGVVHWTHHDPARRRAGGWIEVKGKRYE